MKDVLSRDAQVISSIFMSYLEATAARVRVSKRHEFRKSTTFIRYRRYFYNLIYYTVRTAFLLRAYFYYVILLLILYVLISFFFYELLLSLTYLALQS